MRPAGLFLGKGAHAFEFVAATAPCRPDRKTLTEVWKSRRGGRAAPVLLAVIYPGGTALSGPAGERPPIYFDLDAGQVERLCREALEQPDRHAALRFLSQALPSLETDLPGINNEGLFALHELQTGVRSRSDWSIAGKHVQAAVDKRGDDLLRALGFRIERIDNLTNLLLKGKRRTALAVMLREEESPEMGSDRFNSLSPVSYAFKKAEDENLPWVVVSQGSRLRVYATSIDVGVGRRGRTDTYFECQTSMLADDQLPYLWLLWFR